MRPLVNRSRPEMAERLSFRKTSGLARGHRLRYTTDATPGLSTTASSREHAHEQARALGGARRVGRAVGARSVDQLVERGLAAGATGRSTSSARPGRAHACAVATVPPKPAHSAVHLVSSPANAD